MTIPRPQSTRGNVVYLGLFLVLSGVFLFLTVGSEQIGHWSATTDEAWHFRYGRRILAGKSDRFDDSKMAISALNALCAIVLRKVGVSLIADDWQV